MNNIYVPLEAIVLHALQRVITSQCKGENSGFDVEDTMTGFDP